MILGIGIDLVQISRLERVLSGHREAFMRRIYTPREQEQAASRRDPLPFLAGRWAVKEAVSKALGTGIGEQCFFTDIEAIRGDGAPKVVLAGAAAETARRIGVTSWHLSITHEQEYASAFTIAEKR